jgi:hypothetical protein
VKFALSWKDREENKHKFGVDESGDPKADPQDEVLRQEACEASAMICMTNTQGLSAGSKFERHRNGEYVDRRAEKRAKR